MEPMTLGSPGGSPAGSPSPYLPSFLMGGDPQSPIVSRNNMLSPNSGKNLSFATPGITSPQEFNRSSMGQKAFSGNSGAGVGNPNFPSTPVQGPPTQGLFDALRNERNQVQTPTPPTIREISPQSHFGTPATPQPAMMSGFGINQSYQQQQFQHTSQFNNDSYLSNNVSYNTPSRVIGSPLGPIPNVGSPLNTMQMQQCPPTPRFTEFWITVYGFPPSAASTILQHFAQCGTIIDKIFPPQNGNWVHLKYSSRLECDKALNFNEKILGNNIMIGVTQCKDRNIIDKENICESSSQPCKVRPLAQAAYKSAQNESAVINNTNAPQKSSGFMNKAMDLFFGW